MYFSGKSAYYFQTFKLLTAPVNDIRGSIAFNEQTRDAAANEIPVKQFRSLSRMQLQGMRFRRHVLATVLWLVALSAGSDGIAHASASCANHSREGEFWCVDAIAAADRAQRRQSARNLSASLEDILLTHAVVCDRCLTLSDAWGAEPPFVQGRCGRLWRVHHGWMRLLSQLTQL